MATRISFTPLYTGVDCGLLTMIIRSARVAVILLACVGFAIRLSLLFIIIVNKFIRLHNDVGVVVVVPADTVLQYILLLYSTALYCTVLVERRTLLLFQRTDRYHHKVRSQQNRYAVDSNNLNSQSGSPNNRNGWKPKNKSHYNYLITNKNF